MWWVALVVSLHHKEVQCFVQYSNSEHDGSRTGVSLQEFQGAVVSPASLQCTRLYQGDFNEATLGGDGLSPWYPRGRSVWDSRVSIRVGRFIDPSLPYVNTYQF